jgi:hypothetical protein
MEKSNSPNSIKSIDPKSVKKQRKYAYYKHLPSGKSDEMNWWEWLMIQRDPVKKQQFELIRVVDLDAVSGGTEATPMPSASSPNDELPIETDELECPLCGLVAKTEMGLKVHKKRMHSA